MNKVILTLAILCVCIAAKAQEYKFYGPWGQMEDSSEHYIFSKAFARADTGMAAPIQDTLPIGYEVLLLKFTDAAMERNGILAKWAKIRYRKEGVAKEGYVWGALLSFQPLRRGDTKFVYGIERLTSKRIKHKEGDYNDYKYQVQLIVVKGDNVVAMSSFFTAVDEGSSNISTEITTGRGLSNVLYIPSITIGGGGCGIGMNKYSYTWDGKKLYALPEIYEVGDADAYYHTEQFVFPADKGGKPGMLILNIEDDDILGESDDGKEAAHKITKKQRRYAWDGEKLTLQ